MCIRTRAVWSLAKRVNHVGRTNQHTRRGERASPLRQPQYLYATGSHRPLAPVLSMESLVRDAPFPAAIPTSIIHGSSCRRTLQRDVDEPRRVGTGSQLPYGGVSA